MICIQICAKEEWIALRNILEFRNERYLTYPYGMYIKEKIKGVDCIYYFSEATKTRAAGACQFAISHWNPKRIIVIGTAGGVGAELNDLDLVVASKTVQHDCIETMGSKSELFYELLSTNIDNSWIDFQKLPELVEGIIATGDQDIGFSKASELRAHGVLAADWESGAIAHVCQLNEIPCCIIRGVSDIPMSNNSEDVIAQGNRFRENTPKIMKILLTEVIPELMLMGKI